MTCDAKFRGQSLPNSCDTECSKTGGLSGNPVIGKKPTPLPRTSLSRGTKDCSGSHTTMMGTSGATTATKSCGSPLRRPNKDPNHQQPTMGVSMLKHHSGSPTVLSPRRRRASSSSSDVFCYTDDAINGGNCGSRRLRCPSCGGSPVITIPNSTSGPASFSDVGTQTEASVLLFFEGNGTESRV